MKWVLFFDGDCGMCSRSIRNLARWDREGSIHYAPLQGALAASHGLETHLSGKDASMVLMRTDTEEKFIKGDCMLQILRVLGGAWRILLIMAILPRFFRNWMYSLVARNRRRIMAQGKAVCDLPDEQLRSRLIE